jgi:predicted HTH transcriptional regulator
MEEEAKESEGAGAPKEETLSEEAPSTEAPAEAPQIQPEVKEPQIETQETPPATPTPQPEIPTQPEPSILRQLWQKALEKIRERKSKRLEKILQLASKKGEITNDDVEKLLHVSDRAASRYLNELVRQGRLKRIGSPSHAKYQLP